MSHSRTLLLAGLAGATAVGIGAFGGHGLDDYLAGTGWDVETIARRTEQFETGVRYHLAHSVALIAIAGLERTVFAYSRLLAAASWLVAGGILLFSGSLYVLVLTGQTWLGMITPLGGLSWIAAWSLLALLGWKNPRSSSEPTSPMR